MNAYIPAWNQKYHAYILPNKNIILLGQDEQFFFAQEQYPLFNFIDGICSVDEIAANADSTYQANQFRTAIAQLLEHSPCLFLVEISRYHTVAACGNCTKTENDGVINFLSDNFGDELAPWLQSLGKKHRADNSIKILCVRDFLDKDISTMASSINSPFVLMCFGHDTINLSPVFFHPQLQLNPLQASLPLPLEQFQRCLQNNTPVRSFLSTLLADKDICSPIATPNFCRLAPEQITQLCKFVTAHLNAKSNQLLVINTNGETAYHSVVAIHAMTQVEFAAQLNQPIELHVRSEYCPAYFNKDGGLRSIDPAATLEKIRACISPLTGIIAHLGELNVSAGQSIKIYRSVFFKMPPLKDAEFINENSFVQTCLGKGVSPIQSQVSALCEAIERYSAQYQGIEPLYLAQCSALKSRYYTFQQLTPYSENQYQKFNDKNHTDATLKQAARRYVDEAIHWIPTWSLTNNEQVYIPLTNCFANIPFTDDKYGRWHSNGCAAGNTLEEAILQGLFELIERDAVAIWWYNCLQKPAFNMELINADHLALLQATLSPEHDFWVLNLTHDIGVPVMAAIAQNKKTAGISFGFGCHVQPALAAQRALTELCQLIPIRDQNASAFNFNAIAQATYLFPSNVPNIELPSIELPSIELSTIESDGDIKNCIDIVVSKLHSLHLETLVLNYSREPLPIKTVKVFVPGLCHIWPQFANERLYQVPVKVGWLGEAKHESALNPQALFV